MPMCHFNKGMRDQAPRTMNCGEVTRTYKKELMKGWGYFNKVCFCKLISVLTLSGDRSPPSLPGTGGGEGGLLSIFIREMYVLFIGE